MQRVDGCRLACDYSKKAQIVDRHGFKMSDLTAICTTAGLLLDTFCLKHAHLSGRSAQAIPPRQDRSLFGKKCSEFKHKHELELSFMLG